MEKEEIDFSIVIPAYNEEKNLPRLFECIAQIDYPKNKKEVIVVNDASQDTTSLLLKKYPEIIFLQNKKNIGRFFTRKKGALNARGKWILFLDARTLPSPDICKHIARSHYNTIIGHSLPQERESFFEIFFRSVRERIFSKFYQEKETEILLTPENFDVYPKGTGVLCVKKEILKKTYDCVNENEFGKDSSDDTKFLRMLVEYRDMAICSSVRVVNYGRDRFFESALHLFFRGAKFLDYYGNRKQKKFWSLLVLPFLFSFFLILLFIFQPKIGFFLIGVLWIFLTFWLSGFQKRFFPIFFMLPFVTILFYSGIIRGIILRVFPKNHQT